MISPLPTGQKRKKTPMFHVHHWIRNSWFALALVFSTHATAQTFLGDLDADSRTTIQDLVRLNAHLSGDAPLDTNLTFLADLNQDGAIDTDDINVMVEIILGRQEPQALPLTTIVGLSPNNGESDVAITRETVIQFSAPLASDTNIDSVALSATFAGQSIAARKHLATDRRSLTLFYPSALPASARVRVVLNADNLRDERGLVIDPDGDGVPGGSITIDFDTLTLTSLPNTSVCGRIFASDLVFSQNGSEFVNRPLPGVTITVDGTQLSVVTDDNGDFRLEDCPAGEFFVHIDGRTVPNVQPPGAFYPNVGKQWTSIPGEETNIGEIYLPIIPPETLQATSDTEDTLLEFDAEFLAQNPKFEGVRVTVPADSLFNDDGTRGGLAGIAPVQPDRLPGTVSSDLPIQDVITIQTDGASNFDVPAPICLPNLEDPLTGERLAPGESAALWSFNHDIGRFEIVGSMTVSEDGTLICTDEGVGVEAPGWHGSSTGTQGSDGTIRTVRRSRSKQEKPGKNDPKADPKNQVKIPCPNDKNKFIVL